MWYRGNTHAHTVICGHADSPAEVVAQWYLDHGYNFLILSEHNHFIDPDSVQMPPDRREDFILIPGEEITGPRIIHSTAMNIKHYVPPPLELEIKSEIIQNHVDNTLQADGYTILNHPNYRYAVKAQDMLPVTNLFMFELYNGHPKVNNFADGVQSTTEELWDELLSKGMRIYGVAADDAHHFNTLDTLHSNPGRGWIMVQASELTAGTITKAMISGHFYSSSGVILKQCSAADGTYRVVVDKENTFKELSAKDLRGKHVTKKEQGFVIEFIGPRGKILAVENNDKAVFFVDEIQAYVRVKVTFRRMHPQRGMEEYYAWGQPLFKDSR